MKKLVIGVLLVNLLAACASQKPKEPAPVVESKPAPAVVETPKPAEPPAPMVIAPKTVEPVAVDPLNDPNSILAKRSVYYPFDVYIVMNSEKPIVQAHAQYLSEHPNRKVRLEGNCDERGSAEYNLGLGQRRADGVKKMLKVGGVKDSQMESVSYGEEKPVAAGHDEESWRQNRRTDLNYLK